MISLRKVVLYSLTSLNGVAEHVDKIVPEFDAEMDAHLARTTATQDAILLGRRTYDDWAAHWPTSDDEPFASWVNGVRKYAFTASPPADAWPNTTFVTSDAVAYVRDLKQQDGGDIGVHGSIALARSLMAADLVDDVRLVICPTLTGKGRALFEPDEGVRKLRLVRSSSTSSGALTADYERYAEDGPA